MAQNQHLTAILDFRLWPRQWQFRKRSKTLASAETADRRLPGSVARDPVSGGLSGK